ncbi:MAG: hypothetical protein JW821_10845, partial [Deltaproteobacteria bacterium]|nr:hypothetical protein [Deltaproteobacteria bacterium]
MGKAVAFFLLLWACSGGLPPAGAQNPFISKGESVRTPSVPTPQGPLLARIAAWQQQLNRKMAALTREARETESLRPLFSLIAVAFAYGMVHAAGPGHGKAVAAAYIVSAGRRAGRAVALGNLVAFFHGLSGVLLVLSVQFLLQRTVSESLEDVTRTTQILSYGLIVVLGAALLAKALFSFRQKEGAGIDDKRALREDKWANPLAMAAAVGMVPCPGVVLVMLFCVSMDQTALGLVLAFFLVTGMAATISAVCIAGLAGKN